MSFCAQTWRILFARVKKVRGFFSSKSTQTKDETYETNLCRYFLAAFQVLWSEVLLDGGGDRLRRAFRYLSQRRRVDELEYRALERDACIVEPMLFDHEDVGTERAHVEHRNAGLRERRRDGVDDARHVEAEIALVEAHGAERLATKHDLARRTLDAFALNQYRALIVGVGERKEQFVSAQHAHNRQRSRRVETNTQVGSSYLDGNRSSFVNQ